MRYRPRPIFRILLLASLLATLDAANARQPNVVLIMADDLGYRDLSCYGHPSIHTPEIDRLAENGIRLTNFHSGATVCTPSRMALMTGAYPIRVGWKQGVAGYLMGWHDGLSPEALTIAEIFASEGYVTAISGKWHLGDQPDTRPPNQGFQSAYYLTHSNNQSKEIWRGDDIVESPFKNCLLTEKFTTEAIRFIRATRDRPFFLYQPYTAPHFPVEPHPDWKGHSDFGDYGDVVEEMDSRIGTLLATLKDLEIQTNTIVIFTSDNGPNPNQKADSFPFRGEKWSALEGGTRVPCIISWPGMIPAGRVSDSLVSAMDLLPSLSRACGIDWQAKAHGKPRIDGVDIWDLLLGNADIQPRRELLYWQGTSPIARALLVDDWKLFFDRRDALEGLGTARMTPEQAARIKPYQAGLKPGTAAPPMLFNLSADCGETEDLSEQNPEKVQALRKRGAELMKAINADGILPLSTVSGKE